MNEARLSAEVIDRDAAAALMAPLTALVLLAGAAILAVNRQAMKIDGKTDGSPVTEADLAADRIIADGLARPRWPWRRTADLGYKTRDARADPHAQASACGTILDRGGEPFARRCRDRSLY